MTGSLLLPLSNLKALEDLTDGHIKTIRGNIKSVQGGGGTMGWFMDKEAMVIVDTQNSKSALAMVEYIKTLTDRRIDYVINTHHHSDHIGGNINFKSVSNNLIAHKNCGKFQDKIRKEHWRPTIKFEKTWSKKVGSEALKIYNFGPGHTFGDAIVHFENTNVVHAGDLIWHRRGPRVDHAGGCNIVNWIKVLSKMEKKFDKETIYIFGHANKARNTSGKMSYVKEFREYLENTVALVDKNHKAGYNLDEILKIREVPGSPEWPYSARTLKGAYDEVTGKVKT